MANTPSIYVKLISEQFAFRRLGSEVALFNLSSGKTHLLDSELVAVFDLLGDKPKTKTTLITEAAPRAKLFENDIENFVDHALLELQDIGLIDITESP